VMISKWSATQFSLTVYESTGPVCADESTGHPLETFSVMISERAATLFFFIVSESTGAVCAQDSMRHLWKQFRRLFLRGQRLSFP
jgi:hypothetical protein